MRRRAEIVQAQKRRSESLELRLKSKEEVPMVEDFPLAPEEETPGFQHLATGLQLRLVRAVEHWRGNTHLTLTAIVLLQSFEEGSRTCRSSRASCLRSAPDPRGRRDRADRAAPR